MKVLQFSITIKADRGTVWKTMLEDRTYREWTKPFRDGSYYMGNWEKGSEIRFLAPTDDGGEAGMISRIKESIPRQFISIEHIGLIANGVVDTTSDEAKKWSPSFENYTFTVNDGSTGVTVDMQVEDEYATMFNDMWPDALKALKTLCEKHKP